MFSFQRLQGLSLIVFLGLTPSCAHRTPASVEKISVDPNFSQVRQDLIALYPDLTPSQMDERARNLSSSFKFLRSFVPYYYSLVSKNQPALPSSLNQTLNETGWCFGDAHPENFGALLQSSGKSVFSINDVDDAGPCPLVLDLLRFVVASRLASPQIDLKDLLNHYNDGLDGKDEHLSRGSQGLIDDSQNGGTKISKKLLSPDGQSLVRGEGFQSLAAKDFTELKSLFIKIRGGQSQVLDAMWMLRMEGGSGGLRSFVVLLNSLGDDLKYPQVVELKEIRRPGIFPVASGSIPVDSPRYMATLKLTQNNPAATYQVVTFLKKSFWVRPKWKGAQGVSLADLPADSLDAVIKDEAGVLGSLHRKSAKNQKAFAQAVNAVSTSDWDLASNTIVHWFDAAYTALKEQTH